MSTVNSHDQARALRELVSRERHNMKIISVTSGKGGVGKTSVTVNLALALSRLGQVVLVVDADFGLANIDVMLGINSKYNLSHLIKGQRTLDDIIQQGYQGVRFISGGSGIFELLQMESRQIDQLVGSLLGLDNAPDVILFDTGAGINENILRLVMASSEAIVVTTPEPTAILDAYALVKTISRRADAPPVRLIMNKAENRREADNAVFGFQGIIRKYLGIDVEALGCVLFDAEVTKSIKRQTPLLVSHPNGQTAREIMAVARRLLQLETGRPTPNNPLSRLFSRVKK